MDTNKSTHDSYRTELFMPIMKAADGKYIAVLSDDSVDRDEEKLSKGCIEKLGYDDRYLAALCNHDNDVFMQVAEWTNRGVQEIDGYTALIAEPRFYKSNPNAKIIQGMLDEGAKFGVSIGAIVKSYDDIDDMRVFTELELLEASFVAIPSNRHGRALAVAKSFNNKKQSEVSTMDKEFTKKDLDAAIDKKVESMKNNFDKELALKDTEIAKLKDDLKKAEDEAEDKAEEAKTETDAAKDEAATEADKKLKAVEAELVKVKNAILEKAQFAKDGGHDKTTPEAADEAFKKGKLPIMQGI